MKTLGTVTFAVLVLVILSGCGATQQVGFGSAENAKASAIDCSSADLEATAEQVQAEVDGYTVNCLEVPDDLLEIANQVNACFESSEEKISGAAANGASGVGLTAAMNTAANIIKNTIEKKTPITANMRKACSGAYEEEATQEKTISGSGMGGSTTKKDPNPGTSGTKNPYYQRH